MNNALKRFPIRLAAAISMAYLCHSIYTWSFSGLSILEGAMVLIWIHAEWDWRKRDRGN
jgi:hypothetical protein